MKKNTSEKNRAACSLEAYALELAACVDRIVENEPVLSRLERVAGRPLDDIARGRILCDCQPATLQALCRAANRRAARQVCASLRRACSK